MPNFKPKANKKIKVNKRAQITLDNKHTEMMKKFEKIKGKDIPEINKKIKKINEQLKDSPSLEERLELEDNLLQLKKNRKELSQEKKKYLLDNSKYIFDYFEKKRDISEGNSKRTILHSFFTGGEKSTIKRKNETNETVKYLLYPNFFNIFLALLLLI